MRSFEDRSTPREEHAARAQRALRPLIGVLEGVEEALDSLLDDMPDAPEELLAPQAPADFLVDRARFDDWDDVVRVYRRHMNLPPERPWDETSCGESLAGERG